MQTIYFIILEMIFRFTIIKDSWPLSQYKNFITAILVLTFLFNIAMQLPISNKDYNKLMNKKILIGNLKLKTSCLTEMMNNTGLDSILHNQDSNLLSDKVRDFFNQ